METRARACKPRRRTGGRSLVRSVVHVENSTPNLIKTGHQNYSPRRKMARWRRCSLKKVPVRTTSRGKIDVIDWRATYRTARRGAPKRRSSRSTSCCTRREGWCADSRRLRRPALGRSTRPSAPPNEAAWIGSCGSNFAPRRGDGVRRPSSRPPSRGRCGRAARAHEQRVGQDDRPTCRDRLRLLEAAT